MNDNENIRRKQAKIEKIVKNNVEMDFHLLEGKVIP
jgi:hypothetical protein